MHASELPPFEHLASRPDPELTLWTGVCSMARSEYADLDPAPLGQCLDHWARAVRGRLSGTITLDGVVEALHRVLKEEAGFRGNAEHYYDPRNSYINEVITRRLGIPITLCTVWMEVGRRAGCSTYGIAFPGHFLMGLEIDGERRILDPFEGGRPRTHEELRRFLEERYGSSLVLSDAMLEPVTVRQMLARMLRNLKAIYLQSDDHRRALRTLNMILALVPGAPEEEEERARLVADLARWN